MKTYIKSILPTHVWQKMRNTKQDARNTAYRIKGQLMPSPFHESLKTTPKILILGVADYENLGDHAIAYAQRKFVDKIVAGNQKRLIVEVPSRTPIRHVIDIIAPDDVLLFTGGGNFGDLYKFAQDIFTPIIEAFPTHPKVFFPQSFTFKSDTDFSDERSVSGKLLAACNLAGSTLTIVARESKSFGLFKKHFPNNNILFTPDIVLSLNVRDNYYVEHASEYKRGVKLFMRGPGEKVLDERIQEDFVTSLKMLRGYVDMDAEDYPSDVSIDGRKLALTKLWAIIAGNEVLVTDRLHGLIFAHITGTPCLVFDNHNSKIKMTVKDWLSNTPGIVFVDPREPLVVDDLVKLVDDLSGKTVAPFDATQAYAPLTDILNQHIND